MTGRKPRRRETLARQRARGNELRAWLSERMAAANMAIVRQRKADLLSGEVGGGHGVTLEMREIRRPEPVTINMGGYTGPNRQERRHGSWMRSQPTRQRGDRQWQPGPLGKPWAGRYVWPTPPGHNTPYVKPRDTARGDRA